MSVTLTVYTNKGEPSEAYTTVTLNADHFDSDSQALDAILEQLKRQDPNSGLSSDNLNLFLPSAGRMFLLNPVLLEYLNYLQKADEGATIVAKKYELSSRFGGRRRSRSVRRRRSRSVRRRRSRSVRRRRSRSVRRRRSRSVRRR